MMMNYEPDPAGHGPRPEKTMPIVTIGIAGGTGAGKTTLARRLYDLLGGETNVAYLVHDSYYKDLSHTALSERANNNFDHPEALETDLLVHHIALLKSGQSVEVPTYDFCTHSRGCETVRQEPRQVILVEGILLFSHEALLSQLDLKVFVDAAADVRLMRRIRRDCEERGRTVHDVLEQYHTTVRPMHEAFVEPSKSQADLIVPSMGQQQASQNRQQQQNVAVQVLANHIKALMNL